MVLAVAAVCGPVVMAQDMTGLDQKLAADQAVMAARLQAAEARMIAEQGLMEARQAEFATREARMTADRIVMMAELEPLELGMELQTGGSVVRVGQVKDTLFAGAEKFAQGASEVTEINLDPSTMSMIGHGMFTRDSPTGQLSSKLNFMVIHSYRYDKPGMYNMEDFDAYANKLTDGSWNCSVHVRSKSGSTDICSRTGPDHETNEMVILDAEPREITLIHMSGKMSLNDLVRMSGEQHSVRLPQEPMTLPDLKLYVKPPAQPVAPKSPVPAPKPGNAPSDSPVAPPQ
jgi:hypothetical protein